MAYIPNTGSTVAFQGTVPWSVLGATTNVGSIVTVSQGSIISINQGSIAAVIIGGSIAANFTPPANQSVSGTVGASIIGLPPVNVVNFPANQSVSGNVGIVGNPSISGTVNVGNFPANTSVSGQIAASIIGLPTFQTGNNSIIALIQGSVAVSVTPAANQSVSGTVGASIIGNVPITITSIATAGGFLNVNLVGGSILTSSTPNQSVSGTVNANLQSTNASVITIQQGSIAAFIVGGSIAASFTPPANQSVSGTVGAQETGTWIVSVISSNPSSMLVGASIIGLPPVNVTNFPTNQNVSGSVIAFQGTTPWVNTNVGSIITVGQGSIAVAIISGSVALASPANQSVSGTVLVNQGAPAAITAGWPITFSELGDTSGTFTNATQATSITSPTIDGYGTALITINGTYGTATAIFEISDDGGTTWYTVQGSRLADGTIETGYTALTNTTRAWVVPTNGSDKFRVRSTAVASGTVNVNITISSGITAEAANVTVGSPLPAGTAVLGSVATLQGTNPWVVIGSVYGNISGSVVAFQGGTRTTSIVSTVPSSVIVGSSIFGQLPAGTAMLGSIAAYQGAVPWVVNFQNSSIIALQAGSVVSINVGSIIAIIQANSIVGTYSEDQASTSADKGLLAFGVRNDTVASLVGSDLDYGAWAQDSAGRHIIKPFAADETRFQFTGSVVSTSVTLISASVIGKRQYITDFFVANTGATTTRVNFQDGSTSVIAYTIAPSGGGSNAPGITMPPRTAPSQDLAFQGVTGTSVLYLTVNGYIAP